MSLSRVGEDCLASDEMSVFWCSYQFLLHFSHEDIYLENSNLWVFIFVNHCESGADSKMSLEKAWRLDIETRSVGKKILQNFIGQYLYWSKMMPLIYLYSCSSCCFARMLLSNDCRFLSHITVPAVETCFQNKSTA